MSRNIYFRWIYATFPRYFGHYHWISRDSCAIINSVGLRKPDLAGFISKGPANLGFLFLKAQEKILLLRNKFQLSYTNPDFKWTMRCSNRDLTTVKKDNGMFGPRFSHGYGFYSRRIAVRTRVGAILKTERFRRFFLCNVAFCCQYFLRSDLSICAFAAVKFLAIASYFRCPNQFLHGAVISRQLLRTPSRARVLYYSYVELLFLYRSQINHTRIYFVTYRRTLITNSN